jgi:hypothetical protein
MIINKSYSWVRGVARRFRSETRIKVGKIGRGFQLGLERRLNLLLDHLMGRKMGEEKEIYLYI